MAQPTAVLVRLEMSEPTPAEAAAGSDIVVCLRASCRAGPERIRMIAPDGSEVTHALGDSGGISSETGDIVLAVPPRVGTHVWRFVLPAQEIGGVRYAEAALEASVTAKPQTTSLAVWDIPSPVVTGAAFKIKVGAKSSADCELKGRGVEILRNGEVAARGALGDTPWPGTAALYWADLVLTAPPEAGMASWTARFEAGGLELPHDDASSSFSAAIVPPPDHTLTVKVVEKDSATPVEEALVRLGAYRAETGRSGLAEVRLPKGRYELSVWKAGYDIAPTTLDLDRDASIEVVALLLPEEDPDARWKM